MYTLELASYAALTFTLWDIILTLPDEVALIWSHRPCRLTLTKSLFLFCRYLGLVIQLCNSVTARNLRSQIPVIQPICKLWLMWQTVTIYTLVNALDVVLILRVYAFYNRNPRIGLFLVGASVVKVGTSTLTAAITIPYETFDGECRMTMPTASTLGFVAVEIILQTIILALTFGKQLLAIRDTWTRTPIVSLIYRDGMISYLVIMSVLIGVMFSAKPEHLKAGTHMVFPAFIALLSSVPCRLILNMLRLAKSRSSQCEMSVSSAPAELTTILDPFFTMEYDPSNSQDE